jgi:hypothetical protein
MAVDGIEPGQIEATARMELMAMQDRHKSGKKFFDLIKNYGPGYGLVGTLIGQVGMFAKLADADIGVLGKMLALAVVATLYGALVANAIAGPIGDKLSIRSGEEILAREAHRLGLDEDDVVIRRRLAQKMSFISDDVAVVMPATEADLLAFFDGRKDQFRLPERYTWRHVVFSAERPGDSERSAAEAALRSAPAGEDPAGDPSLVPGTFSEASREAIVGEFGESFYQALASARESQWTGPVMSPFGAHLIRLESRIPASEPSYDAVREQVREAWLSEERDKRNSEMREEIRRRYRIEFDAGVPRP